MSSSVRNSAFTAAVLTLALTTTASAQEFSPRWELSGRGLISSPVTLSGDEDLEADWPLLDFADTTIGTRFDSALFDDTIGGFALGARITDQDSPLWPLYLYQVEGAVQSRYLVVRGGRTRRPSVGVPMPTLRDEDLLTFIYPLNPYSVAGLEEDALFTDMIAVTARADFRWHAQIWLEALRNTTRTGDPEDAADLEPNSGALRLYYDELPALSKVVFLKHAELAVFGQRGGDDIPGLGKDLMLQLTGSVSSNIYPDPIHNVDVRFNALYQHGITDNPWSTVTDEWRGRYASGAISLRYLFAPYQLERFQASVTFAARRFTDRDAQAIAVVPNVLYRLGRNADVFFQYLFTSRSGELQAIAETPDLEHRFEIAFSYHFSVMLNDTINMPRDLLNADYNYVPVN